MHPVRICDRCRGDVAPPDVQRHVPVTLIREPSKMLVAAIPSDVERNLFELLLIQRVDVARAPYGFFAAKVHSGLRYQVVAENSSSAIMRATRFGRLKSLTSCSRVWKDTTSIVETYGIPLLKSILNSCLHEVSLLRAFRS